jgi:hypothetical protein
VQSPADVELKRRRLGGVLFCCALVWLRTAKKFDILSVFIAPGDAVAG